MEALVLLADWAEAINGKLYVQGGGWSRVAAPPMDLPGFPAPVGVVNCALAIRFLVGWDEANKKHEITIKLIDSDGHGVSPMPGQPPVEVKTMLEVGRPAGAIVGSEIDAALALKFNGLPLAKGRYTFSLEIDGEPTRTGATFDVV